jgi:hypothetical protein
MTAIPNQAKWLGQRQTRPDERDNRGESHKENQLKCPVKTQTN